MGTENDYKVCEIVRYPYSKTVSTSPKIIACISSTQSIILEVMLTGLGVRVPEPHHAICHHFGFQFVTSLCSHLSPEMQLHDIV